MTGAERTLVIPSDSQKTSATVTTLPRSRVPSAEKSVSLRSTTVSFRSSSEDNVDDDADVNASERPANFDLGGVMITTTRERESSIEERF